MPAMTDKPTSVMAELLPCPFCGSTDIGGASGIISCYGCHAETKQLDFTAQATVAWNRRSPPAPGATFEDGYNAGVEETLAVAGRTVDNYIKCSSTFKDGIEAAAHPPADSEYRRGLEDAAKVAKAYGDCNYGCNESIEEQILAIIPAQRQEGGG